VIGAQVEAADGALGRVEYLLVDESWMIRYLVVDVHGRKSLFVPQWIKRATLHLVLPREKIDQSAEYDLSAPVSREHETEIYAHYGMAPYWN
jgi:hypothetical protein